MNVLYGETDELLLWAALKRGSSLMRPHPSSSVCSRQNGSVSKIFSSALSIRKHRLLHLCYLRCDIMLMSHPLATTPPCSPPVIRLDYALLDINAFSANKFTMSIIIFACSSSGKGQRAGQVLAPPTLPKAAFHGCHSSSTNNQVTLGGGLLEG